MQVDLLIYNGNVQTMEEGTRACNWFTVKSGRILELGAGNPTREMFESASEVMDIGGKCIYPGFFDSHVHLVQSALNAMALDLSRCESIEEIKMEIKAYIERMTCERDTIIYGFGLDETKLKEKTLPTRKDLDACSREIPIWINRVEYHTSIVNSRALHMCSIPFTLKGIERDASGLPTGRFNSEASAWIRNFMFNKISDQVRLTGVKIVMEDMVKKGVTSINTMEGGYLFHDKDAEFIHENAGRFPIDMYLYYQTLDVRKVMGLGLKRIGGCIFIDGSFGSHTAALSEPYSDKPDSTGSLFFDQETISEFVDTAHRNGIQIAVHAIGDRAIELILNAYERACSNYPDIILNHRIEHFELPSDHQIERARKLGIIISSQPAYEYYWGTGKNMYKIRLGEERRKRTNPLRKMFDAGLVVAGGSDCDVTPCDPLLGIHAAVNHPNEPYALTVAEAIRMFTVNAAMAVGDLENKGTLSRGKLADFVILDENPESADVKRIKDIQVLATYKEGIELYRKEGV